MNVNDIHIKLKNILNKLDSFDYDNIETWQLNDAFNTAQLNWVRRNLHGYNYFMEGDESSAIRIDDFQILLSTKKLMLTKNDLYYITSKVPDDYLLFKRLDLKASKDCCSNVNITCYLAEHANVSLLLRDELKKPSFEWRETFCTLYQDKIQIWTNNEFDINEAILLYYRMPTPIESVGSYSTFKNHVSTQDVNPDFKDDIVMLIIYEAAKLISGNIEAINQIQINTGNVEQNN